MVKRAIIFSLFATALALLLSLWTAPKEASPSAAAAAAESAESSGESGEAAPASRTVLDGDILLRVLQNGELKEMSMAEYLPMALAGEMPASFHPEALKAQAVALRSYALHYRAAPKSAHPEADVCTDSGCCAAARTAEEAAEIWGAEAKSCAEKIAAAVEATDGQYLALENEAILAMFHSSSMGATEDSSALRSALPYLVSVESPEKSEDTRNLVTTVEVSPEDFKRSLLRSFPSMEFAGEPQSWIGEISPSAGGRVGSIDIAGQSVSGLTMRQLFALRSTDFSLQWTGEHFLFTVSGYGHGLGMSQYGANSMAGSGAFYADILAHYYPGTELVVAVELSG